MGDLLQAITSPDSIAINAYAAAIITSEKRDEIVNYEQTLKKKVAVLTAVESQIKLQPDVYYKFLEILSKDPSMDFMYQRMREQCGKRQL